MELKNIINPESVTRVELHDPNKTQFIFVPEKRIKIWGFIPTPWKTEEGYWYNGHNTNVYSFKYKCNSNFDYGDNVFFGDDAIYWKPKLIIFIGKDKNYKYFDSIKFAEQYARKHFPQCNLEI